MNNNYKLTYPTGDDYYDVTIFNNNFSKLADGIDEARAGGSKGEVIVAASNSKNPLKAVADFVCTSGDCTATILSAIEKAYSGGTVRFLDGDFNFESTLNINKPITLKGDGKYSTKFNKNTSLAFIITIKSPNTIIRDIGMYYTYYSSNNLNFINVTNINAEIDNCYFYIPIGVESSSIFSLSFTDGVFCIRNCFIDKDCNNLCLVYAINSRWRGSIQNIFINNLSDMKRSPVIINVMNRETLSQLDYDSKKTVTYIRGVLIEEEV